MLYIVHTLYCHIDFGLDKAVLLYIYSSIQFEACQAHKSSNSAWSCIDIVMYAAGSLAHKAEVLEADVGAEAAPDNHAQQHHNLLLPVYEPQEYSLTSVSWQQIQRVVASKYCTILFVTKLCVQILGRLHILSFIYICVNCACHI